MSRSQLDKEGAAVAVGFAAEVHCDEVLNKLGKIITIFDSPGVGASPHWVFCCELARCSSLHLVNYLPPSVYVFTLVGMVSADTG